jgi:hypothetical protein
MPEPASGRLQRHSATAKQYCSSSSFVPVRAMLFATNGQSIPGNWFQSLHGWNDP